MSSQKSTLITWREVGLLTALFIMARLALVIVGVTAMTFLPSNEGAEFTHLRDGGPAVDMWYRWDAGFYTSIATYGYDWQNEGRPADDMAFMPIYPLLVRTVSFLGAEGCPLSPYLSTCATIGGLLISNSALLASTILLFGFTARRCGKQIAWRVSLLLLVSPISIFLSGVYTESLFLFFSLLTFVFLERKRFLWAVIAASLAALTRSVGIALCAGLLWAAWFDTPPFNLKKVLRLLLPFVPGLVFVGYILTMGITVGDPLAYFNTYELTWNRTAGTPVQAFTIYFSGEPVSLIGWSVSWIDLFMTLFYLALALLLILRERKTQQGEGVYAFGALLIPIASGTLVGMPRFGAVIFPFYILLGRWADKNWKLGIVLCVSGLLAVGFTISFVTWRWIA